MYSHVNSDFDSYEHFFEFVTGRTETLLLSDDELQNQFNSERILIVGAAGSIGSALAKRLAAARITNLYLADHDESGLHRLSLALSNKSASQSDRYLMLDIRDRSSIKKVLVGTKPNVVIHAAALKHLVMLEKFPREGYLTNILGTLNLVELCLESGVSQFINISTDKAANSTSILGHTKKLAELLTEEACLISNLNQCSVRFGNVFASRGSVIETFIHQIKNDIPVTLTDENVTRFFMSQNEAANLVLAAGSLKESGTFIQNMGTEVKIVDVVRRIATYLNLPFNIEIIKLQQGEKLHEELYDGSVVSTKFPTISKSIHSASQGLIEAIRSHTPESDDQSRNLIKLLAHKFVKTK